MPTINNTNPEKTYSAEVVFQLHDLSKIQKVAIITNSANVASARNATMAILAPP